MPYVPSSGDIGIPSDAIHLPTVANISSRVPINVPVPNDDCGIISNLSPNDSVLDRVMSTGASCPPLSSPSSLPIDAPASVC